MAELPVGSEIAGCRIEAVAGRGGMGVVYRATQLALRRSVALKVITPELASDEDFRARFEREAFISASIEHPNAIPVYEAGERDGTLYLMMRYVEGTDLRALLAREGQLEVRRAVDLLVPVASALHAAHRRGLVHRDVKPANVLIASDEDGDEHVYLTDFGIARHTGPTPTTEATLTRTGAFVGTLDYVAPEQIQGSRGDPRSDIYAFGCMLFQSLAGRVPYPSENEMAKLYAHLNEPFPSIREIRSDLPEQLDAVLRRATAKAPEGRFATAGELAQALAGSAPTTPIATATPPPTQTYTAETAETLADETVPAPDETVAAPADETVAAPDETAGTPAGKAATVPAEPASRGQPPTAETVAQTRAPATAPSPPATPPGAPPPVAPDRPGRPSRRRPLLLVGGAVLGVALVVGGALALLSGRGGDGSGGSGFSDRRTTATSSGGTPNLGPVQSDLFTVSMPAGWKRTDEDRGRLKRTVWRDPNDATTSVLVDAIPGVSSTPEGRARSVSGGGAPKAGVRQIALAPVTLAGRDGFKWEYEAGGRRKVDYFVNDCNDGFAVLGTTTPAKFASLDATFLRVAESLQSRSCP
jgi:protein kinase-like protein